VQQKAFLVGNFGNGDLAEILGVVFFTPPRWPARACFHVRFGNGHEDHYPVSDIERFKIISAEDVVAGRIPQATR